MSGLPLVPDPPLNLARLATETSWSTSDPLYRCHGAGRGADDFNPGVGAGARFNWFTNTHGDIVPVLYAGASKDCALLESIFHDVPLRGARRFLPGRRLIDKCVSELRLVPTAKLRLVELHDPGLLRLQLRPHELTATNSKHYPRTRVWAQELHRQLPWAHGLVWMSARFNVERALVLFGDRVDSAWLATGGLPIRLDDAAGIHYVRSLGRRAGIDVSWPPMR